MIREGKVWILTATEGYLGEIVEAPSSDDPRWGGHYTLRKCSWVADTGRRHVFLKSGPAASQAEIEVYPPDLEKDIFVGAIISVTRWPHALPTETS